MKKFTKLFLSCALVSVVAAASATMAMAAADGTWSGDLTNATYEDGIIKIAAQDLDGLDATQQATILVYEKGAQTIDDNSIVAIDQEAGAAFKKSGVKGTPSSDAITAANTADSTKPAYVEYTVKVGYYNGSGVFTIKEGTLLLGSKPGVEILVGQVDGLGTGADAITTNDAAAVLAYNGTVNPTQSYDCGKSISVTTGNGVVADGSTLLIGQVDGLGTGEDTITTNDAAAILAFDGTVDATKSYNCGKIVVGTVAED